MSRLFRNWGGYAGETIQAGAVIESILDAAARHGWKSQELHRAGRYPVLGLHRPAPRPHPTPARVYLSAGIHGDEPAGPLALQRLLAADCLPRDCELFVSPCLNPQGFDRNTREDATGTDLNRDYRSPQTPLVRAHRTWLEAQPAFDAAFLLHEDWEADGFYLYELSRPPARSVATDVVRAVVSVCPLLRLESIDGWPARGGVVRPDADPLDRPDWPEALYLFMHKTPLNCTFEAPSDYPLAMRTDALVAAVLAGFTAFAPVSAGERIA